MKNTLFALTLLVAFAGNLSAQTIDGVCVDKDGDPIAYVSIGIEGTHVGCVSGRDGRFLIEIPDSLSGSSLSFAHISYTPRTVPVSELMQANGGKPAVWLEDYAFPVEEIVVVPGKLKIVKLNSRGTRFPSGFIGYTRPVATSRGRTQDETDRRTREGVNTGIIMELKKESWIRDLEFDVAKSSFDTLKMRVVIYSYEDGRFTPLMAEPEYVDIIKSDKKQDYYLDLSERNIQASGQVYVGLETVEMSHEGEIWFSAFINNKKYYRNMATGHIEREGAGPGILVKGVELE